jgi:hypothetical protein
MGNSAITLTITIQLPPDAQMAISAPDLRTASGHSLAGKSGANGPPAGHAGPGKEEAYLG